MTHNNARKLFVQIYSIYIAFGALNVRRKLITKNKTI
jgi:hypothetical protein